VTGWRKLNSIAPFTANQRDGLAPLALPEAHSRAVVRGRLALRRSFFLHHWRTGWPMSRADREGRKPANSVGWRARSARFLNLKSRAVAAMEPGENSPEV
jgi:hypothetical protein